MIFLPRRGLQRFAFFAAIVLTASCSLFVDLDALQGGDAGGSSDGGGDTSTTTRRSILPSPRTRRQETRGPLAIRLCRSKKAISSRPEADQGFALFKVTLTPTETEGWVAYSYPADASFPAGIAHGTISPDGGVLYSGTPDIDDAVESRRHGRR